MSFRAFLVLARYNGFRGSICVTDMVELIQGIPSGRVYMRETGSPGSVYSVGCQKRSLTSVFRTSLMQNKHMLKRIELIRTLIGTSFRLI